MLEQLKECCIDVIKAGKDYDKLYFARHNLSRWFVIYGYNHRSLCEGGILFNIPFAHKIECLRIGTGKLYHNNKKFVNNFQADKEWYYLKKRLDKQYGCLNTVLETIEKYYNEKYFKTVYKQFIVSKEGTYDINNSLREGIMLKKESYESIFTYNIFYVYDLIHELYPKSLDGKKGGFLLRTNKLLSKQELIDLVLEKHDKFKIVNVGDLLKDKKVFVY